MTSRAAAIVPFALAFWAAAAAKGPLVVHDDLAAARAEAAARGVPVLVDFYTDW